MSLGFLTESALLPSKAKSIKVSSKSVVDLKALVYAKEQELSSTTTTAKKFEKRGGKRRRQEVEKQNSGIAERIAKDDLEAELEKKTAGKAQQILQQKARLYDQLKNNNSSEGFNGSSSCLVDFTQKTMHQNHQFQTNKKPRANELVETRDEFGRTVFKTAQQARQLEMQARQQAVHEGDDEKQSSFVVSQWEKTLKSNEKDYLQEIHQETQSARQKTGQASSIMEDKRKKKLLRLQQLRAQKQKKLATTETTNESGKQATDFLSSLTDIPFQT